MALLSKEFLGRLAFELTGIIAAVLIALGVNEVRENYAKKERVRTALAGISAELEYNIKFLDERIPYYRAMADTLTRWGRSQGKDKKAELSRIPGFHGINPPILSRASWETAIAGGTVANMDFKMATSIARVYAFQDAYLKWIDLYLNAAMMNQLTTNGDFEGFMREMETVGLELQKNYGQILERLKTESVER